jgi:hypothetical protein
MLCLLLLCLFFSCWLIHIFCVCVGGVFWLATPAKTDKKYVEKRPRLLLLLPAVCVLGG